MIRSTLRHVLVPLLLVGVGACTSGDGDDAAPGATGATGVTVDDTDGDEFTQSDSIDDSSAEAEQPPGDPDPGDASVEPSESRAPRVTEPSSSDQSGDGDPDDGDDDGDAATDEPGETTSPTTVSESPTTVSESPTTVSGDGSTTAAQDEALADAYTTQLRTDDDDGFGDVFDTDCLGREFVGALGGAASAETRYGITAASVAADPDFLQSTPLTEPDADAMVVGFGRCGDFLDLLLVGITGSADADEDDRCVLDALPDGSFERLISEGFQGIEDGPDAEAFELAFDDAFTECFG